MEKYKIYTKIVELARAMMVHAKNQNDKNIESTLKDLNDMCNNLKINTDKKPKKKVINE